MWRNITAPIFGNAKSAKLAKHAKAAKAKSAKAAPLLPETVSHPSKSSKQSKSAKVSGKNSKSGKTDGKASKNSKKWDSYVLGLERTADHSKSGAAACYRQGVGSSSWAILFVVSAVMIWMGGGAGQH